MTSPMKHDRDFIPAASGKLPEDLRTSEPRLDSWLASVYEGCRGSRSVRQPAVAEIRDHLLESFDRLRREGHPPSESAERALAGFGKPDELAHAQRKERWGIFRRQAARSGLLFAGLMLVYQLLSGQIEPLGLAGIGFLFAFNAVFFGGLMGAYCAWFMVPSPPEDAESGGRLRIYSPRPVRWTALALAAVMLFLAGLFAAGALGAGPLQGAGAAGPVWALLALYVALSCRVAFDRLYLDTDALVGQGLAGSFRIRLEDIHSFRPAGAAWDFLWPGLGKVWAIRFRDGETGQATRRLTLNDEMVNTDRLIARLEASGN